MGVDGDEWRVDVLDIEGEWDIEGGEGDKCMELWRSRFCEVRGDGGIREDCDDDLWGGEEMGEWSESGEMVDEVV